MFLALLVSLQLPSQLTTTERPEGEGGPGEEQGEPNNIKVQPLGNVRQNRERGHLLKFCFSPDAEWTMTFRKPYKPEDSSSVEESVS